MQDRDRRSLERFAADCAGTLGSSLRAVLAHGSGADGGPGLATTIVVDAIGPSLLQLVAALAERWRPRGLATPLLLDDEYLETSRDVFPLELLALRRAPLLLHGDRDPFSGLEIHREHLRLEIEQQLKGKILHLRQCWLELASKRRQLRALLLDSSAGFEPVLLGLLELAGQRDEAGELVSSIEARFGVPLPAFRQVLAARRTGSLALRELPLLFERYVEELLALARVIDRGSPS